MHGNTTLETVSVQIVRRMHVLKWTVTIALLVYSITLLYLYHKRQEELYQCRGGSVGAGGPPPVLIQNGATDPAVEFTHGLLIGRDRAVVPIVVELWKWSILASLVAPFTTWLLRALGEPGQWRTIRARP